MTSNLPPPAEGIKLRQEDTKLEINGKLYGPGTLYLYNTSHLSWVKNGKQQHTISLSYENISPDIYAHKVTFSRYRAWIKFTYERLINLPWAKTSFTGSNWFANENVKIIPGDPSVLLDIYDALGECRDQYPYPSLESDEDDWLEESDESEEEETSTSENENSNRPVTPDKAACELATKESQRTCQPEGGVTTRHGRKVQQPQRYTDTISRKK